MNSIELTKNGRKITLYGTKTIIEKEQSIIDNLNFTGNEYDDRLLIQKAIDENKLKSNISYEGKTVYPFEKIVKAYRHLQKTGSLEKLPQYMYHFFMYACGDIAHYDLGGFKSYYNYSFLNLENSLLKDSYLMDTRYSDLDKIFKELKIGKYFNDREYININLIPLKKLKFIINECGWNVTTENTIWKIDKDMMFSKNFSFNIDIYNKSISNIVDEIMNYNVSFNKETYMENLIVDREKSDNPLGIKEIVFLTDNISSNLEKLSNEVLYNCRLEVETNKKYSTQDINNDYELDMCG